MKIIDKVTVLPVITTLDLDVERVLQGAITAIKEALAQPEGCQCPACKVTPHASNCAVHSEPAYPKGACNCGAQPEQEPVFWYKPYPNGMYNGPIHNAQIGDVLRGSEEWIPLYTTPPQRTWVVLTPTQVKLLWEGVQEEAIKSGDSVNWVFYTHINEALKEKNT